MVMAILSVLLDYTPLRFVQHRPTARSLEKSGNHEAVV